MREFKTASLADQVFAKLEGDIIQGIYPKGEILTELKLVEQLGVSRTPIREALRRLEQERLIADTGKGSVVLGITEEDLVDIMDIRLRVEGLATYYATKNMTPDGLKELAHVVDLQDYYSTKEDWDHLSQLDDKFHDLICTLCGRSVIRDTIQPLHRKIKRYRKASMERKARTPHMINEHRQIYDAIAAGDAELAEKLTVAHIENAKKNMLEGRMLHG